MYKLYYTKDAQKDFKKIVKSNLKIQIYKLLELIAINPYINPPPFKKLKGNFEKVYSRRINLKHRLFYEIDEESKRIKIIRMWSHYGDN